jgi:hypothetical protein
MSEIFDGGPAYPSPCNTFACDQGLTKREWLAGMALIGRGREFGEEGYGNDKIAQYCLAQADAILARIQDGK